MTRKLLFTYNIVFILFVLLIFFRNYLGWQKFELIHKQLKSINESYEVIGILHHNLSIIAHTEGLERGFVLTNNAQLFNMDLQETRNKLAQNFGIINKLLENDSSQINRIKNIQYHVNHRIAFIDTVLKIGNENKNLTGMIKKEQSIMFKIFTQSQLIEETEKLKIENHVLTSELEITNLKYIITLFLISIGLIIIIKYFLNKAAIRKILLLNTNLSFANEELIVTHKNVSLLNEELQTINEELKSANFNYHLSNMHLIDSNLKIEEMNKSMEIRLHLILDQSPDFILFYNQKSELIYMNRAGRKMVGIDAKADISTFKSSDFTPQNTDKLKEEVYKSISETGTYIGNVQLIRADKSIATMSAATAAHKNEGGTIEFFSTIARDVTQQVAIEEDLKLSEQKYISLFENNPQPLLIFDYFTLGFERVNQAAVDLYGHSKEDFSKILINDIAPNHHIFETNIDNSTVCLGNKINSFTTQHLTKNRAIIDVQINSFNYHENQFKKGLILVDDITEQLKADNELLSLNNELTHRNFNLDKYAYVVSHNIRGPIATMMGLCNLFLIDNVEYNATVITNLKNVLYKLDGIITDLSKLLNSQNLIRNGLENVNLEEVLTTIIELLDHDITISNATINHNFEINEIVSVRSYILNIFQNLVSNAIKYKKNNTVPIIHIESKIVDKMICLTFADNGIGIDTVKYKDNLFGMYKRFNTTQEGKGLGLYLIKTEIELLKGTIEVESIVNNGTKFIILIPNNVLTLKDENIID